MEPLTEKQQSILRFIEQRLEDKTAPTQREIARHFGLAQNAVYQLMRYLRNKGYLADTVGHRALRLSRQYLTLRKDREGLPILGRVAAGEPILAQENIEGYIKLDELFGKSGNKFILKITGDSMVDEGITDGDYVVVQPTSRIENGQIGVVLLNDEATVKKIYVQRRRIALKPANKAAGYKTRYIKPSEKDIRIIGKVIGCFKLL
jgi:repressor LexA